MKRAFRTFAATIALAALSFAGSGSAQAPAATAAAPAPKQVKPALWKVADEDTTIYLFGTIHALPKGLT